MSSNKILAIIFTGLTWVFLGIGFFSAYLGYLPAGPELAVEADPVVEDIATLSEESTLLGTDPEPIEESGEPAPEERKADSSDWLSGHLDLLNKLN